VGDNADKFPEDISASIDTDGDGYPDEWNEGYGEEDSTTGLKLDRYPEDEDKWKKEKDSPGYGALIIITAIISLGLLLSRKRK